MQRYRAAVIGCGRIGAFFDSPESQKILTHAHAYHHHPRVQLAGVMDIDPAVAEKAGTLWNCKSYTTLEKLFAEEDPQLISICAPDEYHYDYLKRIIQLRPKAVIAEKPLTQEVDASREIVNQYWQNQIPLFVNYARRYDKTVQKLKKIIDAGECGQILHARATYTKGVLHNGSHAIDSANYLFGTVVENRPLSAIVDYQESDPTLNAFLSYTKCPHFFLMAGDERCYSIFELDIVTEKKRFFFDQFGLKCTEYAVRQDPVFEGYRDLAKGETVDTGLDQSLLNLIDNVINHLEMNEAIVCSGEDALQTQVICSDLLKQYFESLHRKKLGER